MSKRRGATGVLLLAFTLIAAACGDDDAATTSAAAAATTQATATTEAPTPQPAAIVVTSPAYGEGEGIPTEFTCVGAGTQPPYTLSGLPSETMSIAVVMDSSGETTGTQEFPHWVQFDMPPESEIPQDASELGTLGSTIGALGYAPPCPQGDNLRIYTLKVFAVDSLLGLDERTGKAELLMALEGRVVGYGELTGEYSRP